MKIAELRKKSVADLEKQAEKLRAQIASGKIEKVTNDEKNFKQSRNVRKDLARVLTILNEDEAAADTPKADDKKESK